jgi:hypothetical protein
LKKSPFFIPCLIKREIYSKFRIFITEFAYKIAEQDSDWTDISSESSSGSESNIGEVGCTKDPYRYDPVVDNECDKACDVMVSVG